MHDALRFPGIFKVRRFDDIAERVMIFAESRTVEVALQELCDCHILRHSADQAERTRTSLLQNLLRIRKRIDKERNCHEYKQEAHEGKLHQHDLPQRGMVFTDRDNKNAAKQQLHPAGIRNLVRHLKGNDDPGERVDHGGERIEGEQIGKIVFSRYGKVVLRTDVTTARAERSKVQR